ncbi:MAG: adenylosuccinate lyase [Sphaerochaetaceae bacterium]|nr:adenylosuccinate lyase [Sphaerochaetaceae bacterium]
MENFGFDTFISPLTWRYGSSQMKELWSEVHKRKLLRRVWVALAKAQNKAGIVSEAQLKDLMAHMEEIDIPKALEIESVIHHDLMAEIKTYENQCPIGGGIIHLGCTSMDVLDNADALRLRSSLDIIIEETKTLLKAFIEKIKMWDDVPCMAFTHIQSAEVTTVGYRLALVVQDLSVALSSLEQARNSVKGKGFKGAVGSMASFDLLLEDSPIKTLELEKIAMDDLDLPYFDGASQVYPRSQDLTIMQSLDFLCCVLSKFALDFRMMQSTAIGEWSEPFGKNQVGSSAMPFKRNPINCEKVDSLCRYVHSLTSVSWENNSVNILERTLDDSANRRLYLPQAFLSCDEILITLTKVVKGMNIHEAAIKRNLTSYGVFAATEKLLMATVKKGANRQKMHEIIRENSLKAWQCVQEGRENNLKELLSTDPEVLSFLSGDEVLSLLDASTYTGRATELAKIIVHKVSLGFNI